MDLVLGNESSTKYDIMTLTSITYPVDTPCTRTFTSILTGEDVNVTYGTYYFSGKKYLDQVAPTPNLVITNSPSAMHSLITILTV
ncbi:hypothetical protein JVT61DRAFT_433 [Boletus reticuloceps]|uniref:Uncharacterized protein n=1 Tax=Boletus reticuloceps TaxID=495285 RepID=A0A8I2Z157_9AGAM|nr:hypothetical protein JVT61DRAFT_433 [Boletus reticuloceps]